MLRVRPAGDPRAVERAAHNLKGASANIGATVLAAVCAQIERHAHQAQPAGPANSCTSSTPSSPASVTPSATRPGA